MGAGRPKDTVAERLPSDWQDRMRELAMQGASELEVRLEYRLSEDLWYRWIREEPEFSKTVKECKELCRIWWERHGRKMAEGTADGNAVVWIFNMKNRFGWKDKTETEHSGHISVSDLTDEELERRINAFKTREN